MNRLAMRKLVLGLVILFNIYVWPKWMGIDGWMKWFGLVFAVWGLYTFVAPSSCPIGGCGMPAATKKRKKRK